jgi:hypothetical protein
MEDIPSAFRGNAWIAINGGSLSTDQWRFAVDR